MKVRQGRWTLLCQWPTPLCWENTLNFRPFATEETVRADYHLLITDMETPQVLPIWYKILVLLSAHLLLRAAICKGWDKIGLFSCFLVGQSHAGLTSLEPVTPFLITFHRVFTVLLIQTITNRTSMESWCFHSTLKNISLAFLHQHSAPVEPKTKSNPSRARFWKSHVAP